MGLFLWDYSTGTIPPGLFLRDYLVAAAAAVLAALTVRLAISARLTVLAISHFLLYLGPRFFSESGSKQ